MGDILVVTAVPQEAGAVSGSASREYRRLGPYEASVHRCVDEHSLFVIAGGIGPAASAAATATALALHDFSLAISAGIGGGFSAENIAIGDVVLASTIRFADLGAHSPELFLDVEKLGWGNAEIPCAAEKSQQFAAALSKIGLRPRLGPIVTVAAATGTDERAAQLHADYRPLAEAMEGAGVAAAAVKFGTPLLEIRAISNLVGRRNPPAWDIPRALGVLGTIFAAVRDTRL